MHTNRSAALAITAGSLAGLVTMAMHPTGHDLIRSAEAGEPNVLIAAAHWLAIIAQPLILAGTLALTLQLRRRRDLAAGGFVFFALASAAVIIAAAASGLLGPAAVQGLDEADAATRARMLHDLHFTHELNQTFASVFVVFSGIAIALWSAAMVAGRELSRGLGGYGLVLGAALLLGMGSGHLTLDIHGFGAIVIGISVWMVWAAVLLWRSGSA